ncbi:hypothetical protein BGX38DRAFT_1145939 [Terfezia claveryi]|nr:hypothetical protein BGX38DRAFT_1145939 [Terfezia claveryi]
MTITSWHNEITHVQPATYVISLTLNLTRASTSLVGWYNGITHVRPATCVISLTLNLTYACMTLVGVMGLYMYDPLRWHNGITHVRPAMCVISLTLNLTHTCMTLVGWRNGITHVGVMGSHTYGPLLRVSWVCLHIPTLQSYDSCYRFQWIYKFIAPRQLLSLNYWDFHLKE